MISQKLRMAIMIWLLLIAGYMISRLGVYSLFESEPSLRDWIVRDSMMNLPRLAFGLTALWLGIKSFGAQNFGFTHSGPKLPIIVLVAELLILYVEGRGRESFDLTGRHIFILGINSAVVGAFEEILFRGFGIAGLRNVIGRTGVLVATSSFFCIFHLGAQPLVHLPVIFMIGFLYGMMRINGVSLFWLIFIHSTYDASVFILSGPSDPRVPVLELGLYAALLLIMHFVYFQAKRKHAVKASSQL